MAITLYFSDQLEQLADKFSDIVADENRNKADIFTAPVVIVPNANLTKWLKLFLAKKHSIFMNMDFKYLESGLWDMLASLDSDEKIPEMLDNDLLKILLLYSLQSLKGDEPEFLPITKYLGKGDDRKGRGRRDEGGGTRGEGRGRREEGRGTSITDCTGKGSDRKPDDAARLWQLSEKLAYLFREYEFHRIEMIRSWSDGTTLVKDNMELCQKQLYLRLKALKNQYADKTGHHLLSIMEYAEKVFSCLPAVTEKIARRRSIHFFGLSQISVFYLKLIGRLQTYYDIFIYAVNPCREFWEDIKTPWEKRWINRKNVKALYVSPVERKEGMLFHQDDNALLAAWGKPGRESIRLLCDLTDYEFNACFTDRKPGNGILQRIQKDILTLSANTDKNKRLFQDRSFQVAACPSIYREVETVYNSILFNLEQDSNLKLTDIAILVPDISTYKPVFDSIFNSRPGGIEYNLVDSHAEIESIYGQAILKILALATGRFSRKEVFDLILNPCFMSRWKINSDEVQTWANWAKGLNIFHTFDRETKNVRGYPATGAYTWEQGLQRLRLSRIMDATNADVIEGFKHFQELVVFNDIDTGDENLVEKFCIAIEALHNTVTMLNVKQATGAEWKRIFFNACDELIEIPGDLKGESIIQQTLTNAFDNLEIYDRLQDDGSISRIDPDLIREFVRTNLSSISGGHGNYLTGGITISELRPMRPIPFNIVYVLGMEEGNFPGKADMSSLDLRLMKRQIGDISLPERNCYLFLEMLISIREKLYICFVSRDLQKDRILQPCSVVNRLLRYVEQEIFPEGQRFLFSEIPLKGSSERYLNAGAINEWTDVLVNYHLADRIAYYRANGLWGDFKKKATPKDLTRIERFDPVFSFDNLKLKDTQQRVEKITSKQLKKFLEDPVRQSMQRHLGIYDEEETIEDMVSYEDEPFFSEFPLDYNLKIEPVKRWLDALFSTKDGDIGKLGPEDIYDIVYDDYRRKSQTPEGVFADLDKNELRDCFSQIVETLAPVIEQMQSAKKVCRAVFMGEQAHEYITSGSRLSVKRFDPLLLTVQTKDHTSDTIQCEVELHGQIPWIWQDSTGKWHTLILTGSGKNPKEPDKYVLEPVICYLFCLIGEDSSQWIGTTGITLHIAYQNNLLELTYKFNRETAKKYLTDLTSEYLNRADVTWLPFETVMKISVKPHKLPDDPDDKPDDEVDDIARKNFQTGIEDAYSKEKDYLTQIIKPKIPIEAFDMVQRRFKLFFNNIKNNNFV